MLFSKEDFCSLFFVSMRVRQGGGRVRTSPRSRPCSQQQQQQQQQAVYKIHEGKAPLVLLGGAGTGGFETGRNPMSMIGEKNAGGGGFRLIRHHSAVYEHDIRTNSSSLLRTVSELREELHLGLPQNKNNQKTALDVVSGFPAITTDDNKKQTSCGTRSDAALKIFTEVSHQVPLSPGAKKARHIDGFVYKNYSLQNRRTLSFPVGKEYLINEYVGKRKGRQQQSTSPPPLPRSFSFTTTRLTETLTVAKDDTSGGGGAVSCNMDFGAEVDRHSKMDLFLQAAFTVLTTVAGIFTVYIYMQFFMSSRHDGGPLHDQQEVPLQHESSFAALQEEEDLGSVSFFYYSNMLARVLFFPFLAVLIAVVCAIITTRAWRNFLHGDGMWSRFHDADTCSHCEEVEDSRMRIEQADEKVQRAQQAKQQFMAYVFHNIRG